MQFRAFLYHHVVRDRRLRRVAQVRALFLGANLGTNQAAERRKIEAHGASRGSANGRRVSPGGAQEAAFGQLLWGGAALQRCDRSPQQ